jgi:hypothetical protein
MFSKLALIPFSTKYQDYHQFDDVDQPINNLFSKDSCFEHLLYYTNWIDTVQWHFEDIIRDPKLIRLPLNIKKVESMLQIKSVPIWSMLIVIFCRNSHVNVNQCEINSESPAWAFDRLSILALKIYHMQEEVNARSCKSTQTNARPNSLCY